MPTHQKYPYKPHKLFWTLINISHILPNLDSHKCFPYWPTWAQTNTSHTITKTGPQNYTVSIKVQTHLSCKKNPKSPTKSLLQSPLLHSIIYKACCYMEIFLKNVKILLNLILFGNILQKVQYYFGKFYKKSNTILALFTKKPKTILAIFTKNWILFWQLLQKAQHYFGTTYKNSNIILVTFYN